jgi:hypothetical protein
MTIFGFNTDVKHGDVIYHVQTEARPRDLLLQTLVFVKGQCISKHATSYASNTIQAGFSEQGIHELLKAQHRHAIETIQQGQLAMLPGSGHIEDIGGNGLSLRWTITESGGRALIDAEVLDGSSPAQGAELMVVPATNSEGNLALASTDDRGHATIALAINERMRADQSLLLRATLEGKSVTRKVRLPISS